MKAYVTILLTSIIFLQGCGIDNKDIVKENTMPVNNSIGDVITDEYNIYYETKPLTTNYTNPKENKYIGAYIENSVYKGDIFTFEENMGEHSMYVFDFNLNDIDVELLKNTIESCILNNAVPYIILTSNSAIYDMKIEDVQTVMDVLKGYSYPMIIELLPYQLAHNYNVDLYKLFYIQAYALIKQENEKVDVAYPIELRELERCSAYTPSPLYYDYLSLRFDVDTKMTQSRMTYLLNEAYQTNYNKPKIVNIAISHYDPKTNNYYVDEAYEKLGKVYRDMSEKYENVVSINYMDYQYNPDMAYPYNERYTLNGIPKIADEYRDLTKTNSFLKKVSFGVDDKCITEYTQKAVKLEDKIYLPNSLQSIFGTNIKTRKINNDDYVELTHFAKELNTKNYYLILDEENGKITISDSN